VMRPTDRIRCIEFPIAHDCSWHKASKLMA
jgi:hypothetical protein